MNDSTDKKPDEPPKVKQVLPLQETTESQLLTPSQLNLPTLSVLQQDLMSNLESYRPKEIVHKDTPAKELVGSAPLPKPSAQPNAWNMAYDLILRYGDFPIRDLKPLPDRDGCWHFGAITASDQIPVSICVPQRAFGSVQIPLWAKFKSQLEQMHVDRLPRLLHAGLLLGGFPIVVTEVVEGPLLLECHSGIHLPGCKLAALDEHIKHWLRMLLQVAQVIQQLHSQQASLSSLHWDSIRIDRNSCQAKLLHWPLAPWLFRSPKKSDQDIQAEQQKDRELFGRFLFHMLFQSSCHESTWSGQLNQPLSSIATQMSEVPSLFQPFKEIVLRCIKSPNSQHYGSTELLVEEMVKQVSLVTEITI